MKHSSEPITDSAPSGEKQASEQIRSRGVFPTRVQFERKHMYTLLTALYNMSAAALGLLVLAPFMIIVTLCVKLSSPGPALYRGRRIGLHQREFDILKFRTMKVGSEAKIAKRLVRQDEDHYTSIGRFLRKYRLDELPQLFNVLKRDMNLVGPRPVRPIFLKDHKAKISGYERRFLVRPGITGQAQVRGGYYTSPRHKLFYEMLHISRRTVLFDLQLIILTFARVMTRIFTTTLLLCWLLVMVIVAPAHFREVMTLSVAGVTFNILYLLPTLIVFVHLAQRRMDSKRVVALRSPTDLPVILFIIWTLFIIPFSPMPLAALRGLGWWVCNGFVVFYLILNSRMVTDRRSALIGVLVGGVAAVGLIDMIPTVIEWIRAGSLRRVVGHLVNPVLMAVVITLALPLALVRASSGASTIQRRISGISAGIITLTGVLTMSRAGIAVMCIVTTIALWPIARRLMSLIIFILLAAIVGLSVTGDPRMQPKQIVSDLAARSSQQSAIIETIIADERTDHANLATGIGARVLGRFAQSPRYAGHQPALQLSNMYLTVLTDHGVFGLILFLMILLRSLAYIKRGLTRVKDAHIRSDLQGSFAGIIGCVLLFFVTDALYQLPLILAFFSALGLGVGLTANYGTDQRKVYRIIHYRHNL
ncbi:MAG: sugar transferase [Myxococcota bacterium]|nr:sugar transferase [Myxococcota bacterium]